MALKDWKKQEHSGLRIIYFNKNTEEFIYLVSSPYVNKWNFTVFLKQHRKEFHQYSTKVKALKFAKLYMRKH